MKTMKTVVALGAFAAFAAGCAAMMGSDDQYAAQAVAVMKASFKEAGQAKLDRLDQDEVQRLCSQYVGDKAMPKDVAEKIEKGQLALVKYPADGKYLGDWRNGERIAQSGVGKQYSDDPAQPAGGNCYACHQLSASEGAFRTIGPPLHHFGKTRGLTPEMPKYANPQVYPPVAFAAVPNLPRFRPL